MFAFNHVNFNVLDLDRSLRFYRDALGLANQRLARACDAVVFVACGLPLALKGRIDDESVLSLKRQVED